MCIVTNFSPANDRHFFSTCSSGEPLLAAACSQILNARTYIATVNKNGLSTRIEDYIKSANSKVSIEVSIQGEDRRIVIPIRHVISWQNPVTWDTAPSLPKLRCTKPTKSGRTLKT
jgi:hypothetical protein